MKIIDNVVAKRHHLIVEEKDVMSLLKVFDNVNRSSRLVHTMNMEIGNCGWANEPTKWFIRFDTTDRKWKKILAELSHINRKLVLKEDNKFYLA